MQTVTEKVAAAKVLHWSQTVTVGDVLKSWHPVDDRRADVTYWRVLKVCPVKLKVRGESGFIEYAYPGAFIGKADPAKLAEIGVNI